MAEKRMISKVISISKKFNVRLDDHFSRLLYVLLIPHSDDFGRLTGDPLKIKALILPMMDDAKWSDVERALLKLHQADLIDWYEVKGEKYVQINNFEEHQTGLHKRTRSKIPDSPGSSRKSPEIPLEEKGREQNGIEGNRTEGNGRERTAHASNDIESIKENLKNLCVAMRIQGFGTYQLDIVYSYIGLADIEVIEAAIKKSENKPHTYLTNTLNGMINVDRITRVDQLPGAKGGEADAQHEGGTQGVRLGSYTPTSASESITGGQLGWIGKNRGNVVPLPNVQG